MKNYCTLFITLLFLSLNATEASKSFQEKFEKANNLQQQEKFEKALVIYKNLEDSKIQTPELFYNIGNCYYHLKKWAYARAYFEKALQLDPSDAMIHNNLDLTLTRLKHSLSSKTESSYNSLNIFTQHQWLTLLFITILTFSLAFILFKLIKNQRLKKIALTFLILSILGSIFSIIAYSSFIFQEESAVVIIDSKTYENPLEESKIIGNLKNGEKVVILEEVENWIEVQKGNRTFWVKSKNTIKI